MPVSRRNLLLASAARVCPVAVEWNPAGGGRQFTGESLREIAFPGGHRNGDGFAGRARESAGLGAALRIAVALSIT